MDRKRFFVYSMIALLALAALQPRRLLLVVGNSMAPTYHSGELVWTQPVDRPLRRGDVVVVDTPNGRVMKRVALLAGDRHLMWRLRPGLWTELLVVRQNARYHADRVREVAVPPGTIYVLGDHLGSSVDSRDFGPVKIANVLRIVEDVRTPDKASDLGCASPAWRVS